jgi:SAM-dependent methyltransferase
LPAWLAEQGPVVLARQDLPQAAWDAILPHAPQALRRDTALLADYAQPEGELVSVVRELVPSLPGPVLDVGCGRGLHQHTDVVGLDLTFALARAFPGRAVVGDAADPPFEASAFQSVLALNLLDSVAQPRIVLGQADALLASGGTLVIACAYAWRDDCTPARERFTPADLLAALRGDGGALELPHLRYTLERVEDPLPWRLRSSPRLSHHFDCQLVVARKA